MIELSPGKRFKQALSAEKPLQLPGIVNAYTALMATQTGFNALYLSGAGIANASYGLPDLGMTSLDNVLEDVRRVTSATNLPLLVDADTGWGHAFNIARTVKEMIKAGAAAIHIEDQEQAKRCGHRMGKAIVSTEEMCDRIKAAVDAKTCTDFIIMARTDSLATEGLSAAIERAAMYIAAGADMIFLEAAAESAQYKEAVKALKVPILANMTEFGKTPLMTTEELAKAGIAMVLYPQSAFRAMSAAALKVLQTIREKGTQESVIDRMQTREELYKFLDYYSYEKKLDNL